jgi:O-6-methylguanine DNA methyltransferase
MDHLSFQEKYHIIGTKGPTFEGAFITAVKTTVIFCRPSCRARKPKAVRAAPSANGHNRVAIIIPCHRVTGSGGGFHHKQWLLDLEKTYA